MAIQIPGFATAFAHRLRQHPVEALDAFAEAEIMAGRPIIFGADADTARFQSTVATSLGIAGAGDDVLVVGSARTGFSLDPDQTPS